MLNAMFALVLWTLAVLIIGAFARIRSVRRDTVPLNYYALMAGADVPVFISKSTRHIANLFEMPVLFYTAGAVYLALGLTTAATVYWAWAYVITRFIHTLIHLGYNNVLHRLLVFVASNVCLLFMWISIVRAA